jgi:hypothetical protein
MAGHLSLKPSSWPGKNTGRAVAPDVAQAGYFQLGMSFSLIK